MPRLPVEIRKAAWNMHEEGKVCSKSSKPLMNKVFKYLDRAVEVI